MATRSTVTIFSKEHSGFKTAYIHWDGYYNSVGSVGYTLKHYYTDIDKINKLIDLGKISSLGPEIDPPEGVEHNFDNPVKGVTVAYSRDRGDNKNNTKFKIYNTLTDIECEQYNYYFDIRSNQWLVSKDDNYRFFPFDVKPKTESNN